MVRKPSRVRWSVAALLFLIVVLTFVDRINISIAVRYVQLEFGLGNRQIGLILSAYVIGYALFQLPGGIFGDRLGPRKLLTFAVLWWSLFTALTAGAPGLASPLPLNLTASFITMRFLVGVGEAASLPNCNKVIALWMAPRERGFGNSLFLAGVGVGGAISSPLIAWIISQWGWRASFLVSGGLGVPVAALWWWYGRDRPDQHRSVNAEELAVIRAFGASDSTPRSYRQAINLRLLSLDRRLWILATSYFLQGYVTYIFYTWFYLYLVTVRGFDVLAGGYWASVPFLAVALLTPAGGHVSDLSVKWLGRSQGRRIPVLAATICSGTLLLLGGRVQHGPTAVILLGLAAGSVAFAIVNWWASVNDISPANSATLSGIMNAAGNLGGALSPVVTPWIAAVFGWIRALDFAAIVIFSAGALWLFFRSEPDPRSINE